MNDSNSPPDAPRTWRSAIRGNVLALGLVSMLTDWASEMVNPLLPIFLAYLAGGAKAAFWVGLSEGIAETTASLLKIYSGGISDKAGRRKPLVVLGYGLSAFARPVTALAAAAWQVVGLKFVDRIGKGLRTSPRDALIGDSVPKEFRGLAFSFHRMMDHLGAVIGPLVAIAIFTWLLGYAKWGKTSAGLEVSLQEAAAMQLIFGLSIIPGLLAVLMILFKVREIPPVSVPGAADGKSVWKRLPRKFYAFVGIVTLFALGNSSDMFLLLYARDLFGLQLVPLITLWIVLHLSKMVFSIPGGMISDRIGRRPVIVAGWTMYALVYVGMALLNTQSPVSYFVALFIAYGFYFGMTEGTEKALVADFIPSQFRGTAFGIYHGAVGLAALPASLLFGVFWTKVGPQVAFGVGASLAGAAAILMTLLLSAQATQPAAE
jgi:MFS family permease